MLNIIAAIASSGNVPTCSDAATDAFFTTYTPADAEYSIDAVYPLGKEMLKSWWRPSINPTTLNGLKASGWNCAGPWHGNANPVYITRCDDAGLKCLMYIHSSVSHSAFDDASTQAQIDALLVTMEANTRTRMSEYMAKDPTGAIIAAWEVMYEEAYFHTNRKQPRDLQADVIRDEDTYNKPVSTAERGDWSVWGSTVDSIKTESSHMSMLSPQRYGDNKYTTSYGNRRYLKRQVLRLAQASEEMSALDGYKRPNVMLQGVLGTYHTTKNGDYFLGYTGSLNKADLCEKIYAHDILMCLNGGMHGIKAYAWDIATPEQRNGLNKIVKAITDSGLDLAYLWGVRKTDLTISGPTEYLRFYHGDGRWNDPDYRAPVAGEIAYTTHTDEGWLEPQIDWVNIQLEDARYIVAVNSHGTESYTFTISGFPVNCIKAEILTHEDESLIGSELTISDAGEITTTLGPLGHIAYKLTGSSTAVPVPPTTTTGVEQDTTYPRFWKYDNARTLLVGGIDYAETYLLTGTDLTDALDAISDNNGNFTRQTLVDFNWTPANRIYPFFKRTDGKYDLDQWNTTWWTRLNDFLSACATRDIVVQLELFDPWFMRDGGGAIIPNADDDWWSDGCWSPVNNINYGESQVAGLANYQTSMPNWAFWKTITGTAAERNDANMVKLKGYQDAFVARVISILDGELNSGVAYENVLIEVENESPAPFAWSEYWADFIHALNPNRYVTDMQASRDTDSSDINNPAYHAINAVDKFDFADDSQVEIGYDRDTRYSAMLHFRSRMLAKGVAAQRPINQEKIYSYVGPNSTDGADSELAVDRFFMSIFSGHAAVGYHPKGNIADYDWSRRPGEGLTTATKQSIKAAAWLDAHADVDLAKFEPIPIPDVYVGGTTVLGWRYRTPHECYGMINDIGNVAIFIWVSTNTSSGAVFDFSHWGTGSVSITWQNMDDSADVDNGKTNTVSISSSVNMQIPNAEHNTRWLAIVKKV